MAILKTFGFQLDGTLSRLGRIPALRMKAEYLFRQAIKVQFTFMADHTRRFPK